MWIKCKVEWHEEIDNRMTTLFNYRHGESFQRRTQMQWSNADLYPTDLYVKLNGIIIATSNLYLNGIKVPKLSDKFIGNFCKNKFEKVMVEFDDYDECFKLVDNAIVTRPVKTTWTKEEVTEFICNKFDTYYMNYVTMHNRCPLHCEIEKWLEENLE